MSAAAVLHYLATNWLEISGMIATVWSIWLTTKRNMLCWPIVLLADVIYLIVFYRTQLLSDTLLQFVFIAVTLYGWWHWWRGVRQDGEVIVEAHRVHDIVLGLGFGAVGSLLLGAYMTQLYGRLHYLNPTLLQVAVPVLKVTLSVTITYLDAALTAFSLVASWWSMRRHTSNWWLWIVVDVVYVGEYIYKGLWATALLYAVLVGLAALGVREWSQAAARQKKLKEITVNAS